ncbi:oxidoreductase [Agrobacterium radiobacter]|uniref:oxidoreductase n=1 Tax=Agrobacterium radiobacter TaxID=362 RepID=UPI003F827FB1
MLDETEIAGIVQDFSKAAKNAIDAGFDGVELHGANGYLINQFIDSQANNLTDGYGGSLSHRLRFLQEVAEAVVAVVGKDRVGVRLAPITTLQGAIDDTPQATYLAAAKVLDEVGVAISISPKQTGTMRRKCPPRSRKLCASSIAALFGKVHDRASRAGASERLGRSHWIRPPLRRQSRPPGAPSKGVGAEPARL